MEYITQKDNYRCGPVAIFNALLWVGKDTACWSVDELTTLAKCAPPKGTKYRPFVKALREVGRDLFDVKVETEPTLKFIEQQLVEGKALVWNFKCARGRHYALIVDITSSGKTFKVANFVGDSGALTRVRRNTMKQYVEKKDRWQRIWTLSKIEYD